MVEWKTLNELCSKITDGSHFSPQSVEDGFYMPSVKDMTPNGFDYSSCKKISEKDYKSLIKTGCKPKKNDVLVAKDGSMLKYVFPISIEENIVVLSSIAILTPKTEVIDSRYLSFYLLRSDVKEQTIREFSSKGGVPRIILKNFKKIRIPVPSLQKQEQVVSILDTFTASIDNLKEQIAQRRKQYEYYRCCLFSAGKWLEHRIGELTKVFSCPRVFKDQWQKSGVPFWRSSDIMSYHNGVINPRGEVYISQSLYEELSSKTDKIKEGDILVTGGGSIGIPYLKKDNSPLFVKDADLICIQKCSSIIPKYLYHYFLSTDFKLYLKKITHDATIAHYTINQIKDTPIPLPPLSDQQRIVSILDTFEASIQNLEAQLSQREKQYEYYRNKLLTFE